MPVRQAAPVLSQGNNTFPESSSWFTTNQLKVSACCISLINKRICCFMIHKLHTCSCHTLEHIPRCTCWNCLVTFQMMAILVSLQTLPTLNTLAYSNSILYFYNPSSFTLCFHPVSISVEEDLQHKRSCDACSGHRSLPFDLRKQAIFLMFSEQLIEDI